MNKYVFSELGELDRENWQNFLDNSPYADILQYWQWGELKRNEGWQPLRVAVKGQNDNILLVAQVLTKKVPILGRYFYLPHGPVFLEQENLSELLEFFCQQILLYVKNQGGFTLEIEPKLAHIPQNEDFHEEIGALAPFLNKTALEAFLAAGFKKSGRNMQPRFKLFYNLEKSEHDLLLQMKKNTRYNVGLAERKGVIVTEYAANHPQIRQKIKQFYALLRETSKRAKGYPIRSESSFFKLFELFKTDQTISLFEAKFNNKIIAMNISERTKYWASSFYAASARIYPEVKAPYLLRWRSIQKAKAVGCKIYDFWGIIPNSKQHKGYSDNKLSFGGIRLDTYGILAHPVRKRAYLFWELLLKIRLIWARMRMLIIR